MDLDLLGLTALTSGIVSKEVEGKRWSHCIDCTFLVKRNRCIKCGCFMKIKVKFKKAKCPIGIWSSDG